MSMVRVKAVIDGNTCDNCKAMNGKVFALEYLKKLYPEICEYIQNPDSNRECRCSFEVIETDELIIAVGEIKIGDILAYCVKCRGVYAVKRGHRCLEKS